MKKKTTTANSGYLEQLTWLRGIAAFFVVISHIIRATEVDYLSENSTSLPAILYSFDLGTFGVLLFFTLSGTTLYISHINKAVPLSHFYIKRFFRIWPAFSVSLLIYILFQPIFSTFYTELQGFWIEKQFVTPYSLNDIIQYLILSQNVIGTSGLFNNAYWSLPVEFQYYLIFPLLILSLKYMKFIGPLVIGLVLYLIYKFNLSHFSQTTVFMLGFSFCGGVTIGYIYSQLLSKEKILTLRFAMPLLLLSFITASLIANSLIDLPDYPIISGIWNWYILLSFVAVIAVLFGKVHLPSKLIKILNVCGNISYSAYLFHNLIIAALILFCIQFEIVNEWLLFIVFTGTLIGTYYVAKLSFKYIESRGISVGRNLCSHLQGFTKKAL
jgi:peptidoglycan/LPS O-acetylase OafA/YrhL